MISSFRAWVWRAASRIREDADQWRVSAAADSIEKGAGDGNIG
jgi:hypothetical protein